MQGPVRRAQDAPRVCGYTAAIEVEVVAKRSESSGRASGPVGRARMGKALLRAKKCWLESLKEEGLQDTHSRSTALLR